MAFSHDLVDKILELEDIDSSSFILDPFLGSGTSLVTAKYRGINSVGIENHEFMYHIAKGKTSWFPPKMLKSIFKEVVEKTRRNWWKFNIKSYPDFVKKCYKEDFLKKLKSLWHYLGDYEDRYKDVFLVLMSSTLRDSLCVKGSLPYVRPKKRRKNPKSPIKAFRDNFEGVVEDLKLFKDRKFGNVETVFGDAKRIDNLVSRKFEFIITSPPYLNNVDYADHNRLELYFFDYANSWGDITEKVRSKLITASTTQVKTSNESEKSLRKKISQKIPSISKVLIQKLKEIRKEKSRRDYGKNYDYMVGTYFLEMKEHFENSLDVLKPEGKYYLVVGDSAPYGVHIRTDVLLARLAEEVGFDSKIFEIRERGGKFSPPQRHDKLLRESMIVLH